MINSVSAANYSSPRNVQFGDNDLINKPQKNSATSAPAADTVTVSDKAAAEEPAKKKSSVGKAIAWTIGGLVVAAGALITCGRKITPASMEDLSFFKKIPQWLQKAGEAVDNYTLKPLQNLFKSTDVAKATEEIIPE